MDNLTGFTEAFDKTVPGKKIIFQPVVWRNFYFLFVQFHRARANCR